MTKTKLLCVVCPSLLFGSVSLQAEEVNEPSETSPSDQVEVDATGVADESSSAAQDSESKKSPLWPVRAGASLSVGLPQPYTFGLELTYLDLLSVSFHTGTFETTIAEDIDFKLASWDLRARWHVFRGSFFMGLGYGHHSMAASTKQNMTTTQSGATLTVPTVLEGEVSANHVTPMIGWQATWDMGLMVAFDLGVNIPLEPKDTFDAKVVGATAAQETAVKSTKDYKDAEAEVKDTMKLIGETPLPVIALRLGWLI